MRVDLIKVDMITDFSWDQRLHGVTSRDRQSRHSDILADRMQFMTMKSEAVQMEIRRCGVDIGMERDHNQKRQKDDVYVMDASRGIEEKVSTQRTQGNE